MSDSSLLYAADRLKATYGGDRGADDQEFPEAFRSWVSWRMEHPWKGRGVSPPHGVINDAPKVPPHWPTGKPSFDASVIATLLSRLVGTSQPVCNESLEAIIMFMTAQGMLPPEDYAPFLSTHRQEQFSQLYIPALTALTWAIMLHIEVIPILDRHQEVDPAVARAASTGAVLRWANSTLRPSGIQAENLTEAMG